MHNFLRLVGSGSVGCRTAWVQCLSLFHPLAKGRSVRFSSKAGSSDEAPQEGGGARQRRRRYMQEEDDFILRERQRGASFPSIAHRLGRSKDSVGKRFRVLCCLQGLHIRPSKGRVFSTSEDEVIIRMIKDGQSVGDIAKELSATSKKRVDQVQSRLNWLRITGLVEPARQRQYYPPLTESDIERICADRKAGLSWREISVKEDRSSVMLLTDPALRSRLPPRSVRLDVERWTDAEIQKLKRLRDEQGLAWPHIASILGRTPTAVSVSHSKYCSQSQSTKRQSHGPRLHRDFSAEDDATLLSLIEKHGTRWRFIQPLMSDRSIESLRGRYRNYLIRKMQSGNDTAEYSAGSQRNVKRED